MLTSADLKSIREIVREEIGNGGESIRNSISYDIRISQLIVQRDMSRLKNLMKHLEIRFARMNNEDIDEEENI